MKAIIQTPTNKLENSIDFYSRLNFKKISDSPCVYTDGKAVIEINPDRYARAGVKLYKDSWAKEVEALKKGNAVIQKDNTFLLSDPSGTWVYLIEGSAPIEYQTEEKTFGITGNYAGLSLETTDMNKSAAIWEVLGLKKTMGDASQGWVAYADDEGFGLSLMKPLMCPHLFFNPSFTYFNGKNNDSVIQAIRDAQIPIAEEITHFNKEGKVDNIIIRDPGGFGFFIFND